MNISAATKDTLEHGFYYIDLIVPIISDRIINIYLGTGNNIPAFWIWRSIANRTIRIFTSEPNTPIGVQILYL